MGHEDVLYLPGTSLASGCGIWTNPNLNCIISVRRRPRVHRFRFDTTALRALILPCTPSSLRLGQMGIEA